MPPICQQQLVDSFQRPVIYLRISVTDRCNLNCRYCAPFTPQHLERKDLLTLRDLQDRLDRHQTGYQQNTPDRR